MPTIQIRSSSGPYDVDFAPGTISRIGKTLARMDARIGLRANKPSGVYVLSAPRVWRYWGSALTRRIPGWRDNHKILFDDSETAKRLETVEQIARLLVRAGADRQSVIVAMGGGVVGDVAGFVAATYLRGVRLVHIPTTLVAQVDSSIGGKTGVDLPEGKNLVGAFYPPHRVIADPQTLATLPHREYRSGLYEVIKYGVIADFELFEYLEQGMLALLRRDPRALAWIIPRCIAIKARIVGRDEREGGQRQLLNFGHTLGHALEAATSYRVYRHGEAIGWGMIAATLLAVATEGLSTADASRIIRLVTAVGPLPHLPAIGTPELRALLSRDKKAQSGRVRWVLPRRIGKAEWGIDLPWPLIAKTIRALPEVAKDAQLGPRGRKAHRTPSARKASRSPNFGKLSKAANAHKAAKKAMAGVARRHA
jgi:3-dehydroquinate synthase